MSPESGFTKTKLKGRFDWSALDSFNCTSGTVDPIRYLEADATKEMLQVSLAHDEERVGELHQIRSTASGRRAAAVDRAIDRITTHANEIGERLARL